MLPEELVALCVIAAVTILAVIAVIAGHDLSPYMRDTIWQGY